MRQSVYFKIFQTFIQHLTVQPEKFYISRSEFVGRMREYPLSHFISAQTFRNMIMLQMPSAQGIMKSQQKFASNNASSLALLESKSRPNLERYQLKPSIYEL